MSFYELAAKTGSLPPRGDYTTIKAIEVLEDKTHEQLKALFGDNIRLVGIEPEEVERYTPLHIRDGVRFYGYL